MAPVPYRAGRSCRASRNRPPGRVQGQRSVSSPSCRLPPPRAPGRLAADASPRTLDPRARRTGRHSAQADAPAQSQERGAERVLARLKTGMARSARDAKEDLRAFRSRQLRCLVLTLSDQCGAVRGLQETSAYSVTESGPLGHTRICTDLPSARTFLDDLLVGEHGTAARAPLTGAVSICQSPLPSAGRALVSRSRGIAGTSSLYQSYRRPP